MLSIILLVIFGILFGIMLLIAVISVIVKGTVENIVTADAIIVLGVTVFFVHKAGLHIVFSILLGLLAAAIFYALTLIPYFGKPFVVLCGLAWVFGLYQLVDEGGLFQQLSGDPNYNPKHHVLTMLLKNDPIWWWTIMILATAIFVGLHLRCVIISQRLAREDSEENVNTVVLQPVYISSDSPQNAQNEIQTSVTESSKVVEKKTGSSLSPYGRKLETFEFGTPEPDEVPYDPSNK